MASPLTPALLSLRVTASICRSLNFSRFDLVWGCIAVCLKVTRRRRRKMLLFLLLLQMFTGLLRCCLQVMSSNLWSNSEMQLCGDEGACTTFPHCRLPLSDADTRVTSHTACVQLRSWAQNRKSFEFHYLG